MRIIHLSYKDTKIRNIHLRNQAQYLVTHKWVPLAEEKSESNFLVIVTMVATTSLVA